MRLYLWETCGAWVEVHPPGAAAFAWQLSGVPGPLRVISNAGYHWSGTTFNVGFQFLASLTCVMNSREHYFSPIVEVDSDKFPYYFSVLLVRFFFQSLLLSRKVRVLVLC